MLCCQSGMVSRVRLGPLPVRVELDPPSYEPESALENVAPLARKGPKVPVPISMVSQLDARPYPLSLYPSILYERWPPVPWRVAWVRPRLNGRNFWTEPDLILGLAGDLARATYALLP